MSVQEVSVDVPKPLTVKIEQESSRSPVLGPFLLLVAGFIGWAVGAYFDYQDDLRAAADHQLARASYQLALTDDLKIILDNMKSDVCLATAMLDDHQTAAQMVGAPPSSAVSELLKRVDPARGGTDYCKPDEDTSQPAGTAVFITKEQVQGELFTPERRVYAEKYVTLYTGGDAATRKQVVSALVDAIIGPEDDIHRYRVNIYVALTFSLLPKVELSADQQAKLKGLKDTAEYQKDRQFRINVDKALNVRA